MARVVTQPETVDRTDRPVFRADGAAVKPALTSPKATGAAFPAVDARETARLSVGLQGSSQETPLNSHVRSRPQPSVAAQARQTTLVFKGPKRSGGRAAKVSQESLMWGVAGLCVLGGAAGLVFAIRRGRHFYLLYMARRAVASSGRLTLEGAPRPVETPLGE